ncbi:MAG: aminotransferase class I/II-fold pyridoxal phosphate-dependent enzyme [Firmicutes bacterium]|nr:aminotransferase class I/II-fold pyridoxal phosphate-dependent enzyme [Bacillota bacterium]
MTEMLFASQQGRNIPKEDKIFGINNRAKAMIAKEGKDKVVNATLGALLDDKGDLIVLSSVTEVFRNLAPAEFAEYAPIAGTPAFREAVKKDCFRNYEPKGFVEVVAAPGGTGAIKNAVANYADRDSKILFADWFWAPYRSIAEEMGKGFETFTFFNEERKFNIASFEEKVKALLQVQDRLLVILNTPAHNPTGYALTEEDWKGVKEVFGRTPSDKKITLLVDTAYIDFAGDEDEYRSYLPVLEEMPGHVLTLIAHSLSKAYTLYGMRCGATICIAKDKAVADEFKQVCEFSSRSTWSNCAKAPQVILTKIYDDPQLRDRVFEERKQHRDMLISRAKAFEAAAAECGLVTVPFDTGFFVSVPCEQPDAVCAKLEEEGIFLIPLAKGIRVSIASVAENICRMLPARIKAAMDSL